MGLLSIIRKVKRKERELRILMVGLDNAGKTTVVKTLNGEDASIVSPTLGFNIKTMEYKSLRLNIWDVGGQKSLRAYWRNYFEQTEALIWVVDSADLRRLEDCKQELHNLLQEERLAGASLLILANKQDLAGSLPDLEIQKVLDLSEIKNRNWMVAGCSAVTSRGLFDAFDWLVQDVSNRIYSLE